MISGAERPANRPHAAESHRQANPKFNSVLAHLLLDCSYCGEPVELLIDEGGGERQSYVEDCPVCCRPWEVEVEQNLDGSWSGTLRTADE